MADQQSNLQIILRTIKQGTGDAEAQKGLGNLKGELGDLSQGMLGVNLASVGLTAGLVMAGKGALDLTYKGGESLASLTRLDSVLKSTGGSAGMTMSTLTNLSQEMMFLTGVEDEEVQAAEAVLLTFKNMSEDSFPRTIRSAADLAAIFGGDLQSQTMVLAKALSAPGEGMMALERETGKWSDATEKNIDSLVKQGKIVEAQDIIFAEVEKRVGGAAAAMGDTYPGQVKKLSTAISEAGEAFGKILVPSVSKATEALVLFLTWDDKIKLALSEHADEVLKNSKSYDEYVKEMERAIHAAGKLTEAEYALGVANHAVDIQRVADAVHVASIEEYNLTQITDGADDAFVRWKNSLIVTDPELQKAVEGINDLNDALGASKWSVQELAANMYQYQLALDGVISDDDVQKILDYRLQLGLLSQAEYEAAMQAITLKNMLDFLPSNVDIDVVMRLSSVGGGYGATPEADLAAQSTKASRDYAAAAAAKKGMGGQTGLDFTVPPDFEGDNYPLKLRVKSGERVKVETPDQQNAQGGGGGGGNGPLVGTVNNYSMWDREAASAWIRSMT